MPEEVTATFYAQLEPTYNPYSDKVTGAKLCTATQGKPTRRKGGTVLVKMRVRVTTAAFEAIAPPVVDATHEDATADTEAVVLAEPEAEKGTWHT